MSEVLPQVEAEKSMKSGPKWLPMVRDVALVTVVGSVALLILARTFDSWHFYAVGLFGLALGQGLAYLAHRMGQPVVVLATLTVVAFFLLGGAVALNGQGAGSMFPVPSTLKQLADLSIFGWKELLTTLPPVDGRGPFLVLPYLICLVFGVLALSAALRSKGPLGVVLASAALFGTVILLGVQEPDGLLWKAALVALTLLGWGCLRARQATLLPTHGKITRQGRRIALATAMVAVASAAAAPLAAAVFDLDERVVLRKYVQPPFDIGQYPSPLTAFRQYTKPDKNVDLASNVHKLPIAEVEGLAPGTRMRFAVMDQYDGTVWGATHQDGQETVGTVPNAFQRVNSTIDNPAARDTETETVKVTLQDGYKALKVWAPTAGAVTEMKFSGPHAEAAKGSFRYNLFTNVGVIPTGLTAGDSYRFKTVVEADQKLDPAMGAGGAFTNFTMPSFVGKASEQLVGNAEDQEALAQVLNAAKNLKVNGRYTDGTGEFGYYTAGHHLGRLDAGFVNSPDGQMAGNDEQFAAIMALVANDLGVPSRIVLGAEVPPGGVIKGQDVHAWLELQIADGSWKVLPTEDFLSTTPAQKDPPQNAVDYEGSNVPPPAPLPPKSDTGDPFAEADRSLSNKPEWQIPDWVWALLMYVVAPLSVIGLCLLSIVLAKRRRSRARRTDPRMTARLVGGWQELLDLASDFGWRAPQGSPTRPEQAKGLPIGGATTLALKADLGVFSQAEPSAEETEEFWRLVSEYRSELATDKSRLQRVKATLNPKTLLPNRGLGLRGPRRWPLTRKAQAKR